MTLEQALQRAAERERRQRDTSRRNKSIMDLVRRGRSHEFVSQVYGVSPLYVKRLSATCSGNAMVRARVDRSLPGLCSKKSAVLSVIVAEHDGYGAMPFLKQIARMAGVTHNDVTWAVRGLREAGLLEPAQHCPGGTVPTEKGIALTKAVGVIGGR